MVPQQGGDYRQGQRNKRGNHAPLAQAWCPFLCEQADPKVENADRYVHYPTKQHEQSAVTSPKITARPGVSDVPYHPQTKENGGN
jgi:hypothetical protein